MGLISRLLGCRQTTTRQTAIAVHAGELLEVVGESRRQDVLKRLARSATYPSAYVEYLTGRALEIAESEPDKKRWFRAVLIRERDNPADPNAIAVHADGVGQVGYLSRDDARAFRRIFDALSDRGYAVATCPAFLIGGQPDKPSFGVMLCLSGPAQILRDLEENPPD